MSDDKQTTDQHDEPSAQDAEPETRAQAVPEPDAADAQAAPTGNGWADEPEPSDGNDPSGGDEPEQLYTKTDVAAVLAESQDRLLRVMAEYDNFRRRTAREKEQWVVDALEDFVKDLLPVFDSFDKARETAAADDATSAAMREGLDVTHKQLRGVLDKYSIEVIDPVGEAFDPTFHEALMRQPSADHEPGTVVNVFERGYKVGSRLLRPARVVVAAGD